MAVQPRLPGARLSALALVEEVMGRDEALTIARHMVVLLRRAGGQAQFSTQLQAQLAQRQELRDLQQWIAEHPDADLSDVANIRLEKARRLLEDADDDVVHVAAVSGYAAPEAMRRGPLQALGMLRPEELVQLPNRGLAVGSKGGAQQVLVLPSCARRERGDWDARKSFRADEHAPIQPGTD